MARLPEIRPDQRVIFVGKTGSGKTYLARALLADVKRLFVLDAKGTLNDPTWELDEYDEGIDIADPETEFRFRIPSPIDGDWEPYIWAAYYARNCTIYIDEVYGVESGTKPTLALRAVITRGRELGIGVWAATQRPSYIPLIILSESEWLFMFQLRLKTDRQRIASLIGPAGMSELRNHELVVYNDDLDKPIKYRQAKIQDYTVRPADVREEQKSRFSKYRKEKVGQ